VVQRAGQPETIGRTGRCTVNGPGGPEVFSETQGRIITDELRGGRSPGRKETKRPQEGTQSRNYTVLVQGRRGKTTRPQEGRTRGEQDPEVHDREEGGEEGHLPGT